MSLKSAALRIASCSQAVHFLRADLHETVFQPRHAPLLVEREDLVKLSFQVDAVHVEQHADASRSRP